MKTLQILFYFFCFFPFIPANAQGSDSAKRKESVLPVESKESIPEFNYKGMSIQEFILKNIIYPDSLREAGIETRLVMEFTVDSNGSVSNIFCRDSVPENQRLFLKEAMRVIQLSDKKWKPGMLYGKKVKIKMRIPIRFKLD